MKLRQLLLFATLLFFSGAILLSFKTDFKENTHTTIVLNSAGHLKKKEKDFKHPNSGASMKRWPKEVATRAASTGNEL